MTLAPLLASTAPVVTITADKAPEKKKRLRQNTTIEPQDEPDDVVVAEDDPLAWMGVELSLSLRAKILEYLHEGVNRTLKQTETDSNRYCTPFRDTPALTSFLTPICCALSLTPPGHRVKSLSQPPGRQTRSPRL